MKKSSLNTSRTFSQSILLVLILLFFSPLFTMAQITGPEQECFSSLPVCSPIYNQAQYYTGYGANDEIPGSSCLQSGENNTVWYLFTVTSPGNLSFTIDPVSDNDDYDFALYNITGGSCADIAAGGLEVRCNYHFHVDDPGVPDDDLTGLKPGSTGTTASALGPAFLAPLPVNAGETYALVVDNYGGPNGFPTAGFSIDFSASTASIIDNVRPYMESVEPRSCNSSNIITVNFSEPIACSSIAANGSDFSTNAPVSIVGSTSADCGQGSFTSSINLILSQALLTPGTFSISLKNGSDGNTLQDVCGNNAFSASQNPIGTINFTNPGAVSADFSFVKVSSCQADSFFLTNTSTGTYTSSAWTFGDATTSNQTNPIKAYTIPGNYNIRLIVSNSTCSDTIIKTVSATLAFSANFSSSPVVSCPGDPVNFTNTSPSSGNQFFWDFGDGNFGNVENPSHVYVNPAQYYVTFILTNTTQNCKDTVVKQITVQDNVVADFAPDNLPVCRDIPASFTDYSVGTPAVWSWQFGDGGSSQAQNPVYSYDSAGVYTIKLVVTDAYCGKDSITDVVEVLDVPEFSLGNDTSICLSESVQLEAYPFADSYTWSTGATLSEIAFENVPAVVWAEAVLNECPYRDTIYIDETIDGCSSIAIPTAFSPNSDGVNDYFRVFPQRVDELEVKIFNRWGEVIFFDDALDFKWDGTFNGEPQGIGTYIYAIEGRGLNGEAIFEKGNLTLIR